MVSFKKQVFQKPFKWSMPSLWSCLEIAYIVCCFFFFFMKKDASSSNWCSYAAYAGKIIVMDITILPEEIFGFGYDFKEGSLSTAETYSSRQQHVCIVFLLRSFITQPG